MSLLRKYQLDIIFLFFAFFIFIWGGLYALKYFGADPHDYEWFIAGPFVILFVGYLWQLRNRIPRSEKKSLSTKALIYWIALGISLFATYDSPIPATDYWSSNVLFLAFTLYLADSYWDFRAMSLGSIFRKK